MPGIMEGRDGRKGDGEGVRLCKKKKKDNKGKRATKHKRREKEDNMRRKDVRMSLSPFPLSLSLHRTEKGEVRRKK